MTWWRSSSNDRSQLAPVIGINAEPTWPSVVAQFCADYPNPNTASHHRKVLSQLFREHEWDHPHELDASAIVVWCTKPTAKGPRSNNSVRERIALVRTFAAFCHEEGIPAPQLRKPLRRLQQAHPQVLGKTQSTFDANRLDAQGLDRLYKACSDGSWLGSRDQIACRLLALGLRAEEACRLTWRNLHDDGTLHVIGKNGKTREVIPGPLLSTLLAAWHRYHDSLGLPTDAHILSAFSNMGRPFRNGSGISYRRLLSMVTERGQTAGLGHLAPHDLRRSLARIMWETTAETGRHNYELSEIADALGHSMHSLYVTQGAYIGPLGNRARKAAGKLVD